MKRIISLMLATIMFTGCTSSIPQSKFNGESIDPAILVTDFTLFGADGSEWNWKQNSEGKVMVVVFLFTNCLDVCPVVTQNLKWIQESLSEKELTEVGFATITVDPWRDNNETLKQWMASQNVTWPHLTINDTENEINKLNVIWTEFGISLIIEDENTEASGRHHPSSYDVNHTTGTVLVDRSNQQRVWWGDLDWVPDLVLADIRTLIAE